MIHFQQQGSGPFRGSAGGRRRDGWCFLLLWLVLPMPIRAQTPPSVPTESDQQTRLLLDGLRSRRMFRYAQYFCDSELEAAELSPSRRATLTVESMKTRMAEAAHLPQPQRGPVWASIEQLAEAYSKRPNVVRLDLIRVQAALAHIARAQLLHQELAADMIDGQWLETAQSELRAARSQLDRLRVDLDRLIPQRRVQAVDDGELNADQLMTLNDNVRFQLARCQVVRAELYQQAARRQLANRPTQADRVDALNQALQQLGDVERSVSRGQPLWWQTRIAQLEALRLAGRTEESAPIFEEVATLEIPDAWADDLLEQKIRFALLLNDGESLKSLLAAARTLPSRSPMIDLAILSATLQLARSESSSSWLETASRLTRAIESQHGGYWGRRAELLLIGSVGDSNTNTDDPDSSAGTDGPMSANVDLLVRTARAAERSGRVDDAIKAYDRAMVVATEEGNTTMIQSLQVQTSGLYETRGNHREAATRLFAAAQANPTTAVAASAHLRACWNLAKVLDAQSAAEDRKAVGAEFQAALERHLEQYANRPSHNRAGLWLAGFLQRNGNARGAVTALQTITPDSPEMNAALDQLLLLFDSESRTTRGIDGRLADSMLDWLTGIESGTSDESLTHRRARLTAIELQIRRGNQSADSALASRLEEQGWVTDPRLQPQVKMVCGALYSLQSPQRAQEYLLATQEPPMVDRALAMLEAIGGSGGAAAGPLVELQLAILNQAIQQADKATPVDRWRLRQASLLAQSGDHDRAISILQQLESEFPNQASVKIRLAEAITAAALDQPQRPLPPTAVEPALAKWRIIASRTRSHSPPWFEAKYQTARLLHLSGKDEDAEKLLKYLKAIPPGWTGSERAASFEALLRTVAGSK